MKKYQITVNGNTYEVEVDQIGGSAESGMIAPAPVVKAAPAPAAAPVAVAAPAPAAAPKPAPESVIGGTDVTAPMSGKILSLVVAEGQQIKSGDLLLIFEAMKMENELYAPDAGTIAKIYFDEGDSFDAGAPLVTIA